MAMGGRFYSLTGGRRAIRRGGAWRGSVSGAVFEPPARVAGFHDIAVVRQAVEHDAAIVRLNAKQGRT